MKKIAVIGTGIMGRGIAFAAANAGVDVVWLARNTDSAAGAAAWLDGRIAGLVAKGKLTPEAATNLSTRLFVAGFDALTAADGADLELVLEAITEDLERKRAVMLEMARRAPRAVLATNTSSCSVTDLARASGAADRVVGLHFFNPVHAMPLVELVAPIQSSRSAVELARSFAVQLGKNVIEVRDVAGFVVNRALFAMLNETCLLADEGGGGVVADVDVAIRGGLAHPMGPFELMDLIGLDTCLAILESLEREHGPRFHPAPLLRRHIAAGRLGRKTGQGFFPYPAQSATR